MIRAALRAPSPVASMNVNEPLAERRRIVTSNGTTLSVVDYGGAGPAILLLHGLAGRATEWQSTAQWLRQEFHVVALDQRGHGESAKRCSDYARRAYVEDAAAVIESFDLAPAIVIGQSMGALNAYLVAARLSASRKKPYPYRSRPDERFSDAR